MPWLAKLPPFRLSFPMLQQDYRSIRHSEFTGPCQTRQLRYYHWKAMFPFMRQLCRFELAMLLRLRPMDSVMLQCPGCGVHATQGCSACESLSQAYMKGGRLSHWLRHTLRPLRTKAGHLKADLLLCRSYLKPEISPSLRLVVCSRQAASFNTSVCYCRPSSATNAGRSLIAVVSG